VTPALFGYGFRPFFLGVGALALLLVPWWAAHVAFALPLGNDWPPLLWHAHEMLFGFVCAAIAGFLLTAVPSWTGRRGFAGTPLVLLSATWLAGRIAVSGAASLPLTLVAVVDLAFLPALAFLLARPLIRERNRNTPLLAVLAVLWACDLAFYAGLWRDDVTLSRQALLLAVNVVLLLVTVIGGRITPSFTANALRQRGAESGVRNLEGAGVASIVLMIAVAVVDLLQPGGAWAGWVALAAAIAQATRLVPWQGHRTLDQPILWVLHLGYAWLPAGLALKALYLLTGAAIGSFWLHALAIGVIATMILGVMTRVALGHTGRPLRVAPNIRLAYLLLTAAVLVRVFGVWLPGATYPAVIVASAAFWTLAFALFLWTYAPILSSPRVDGKDG